MDSTGPLGRETVDRAVLTLERAFSTDPMFTWIFPDPERRARALRCLNRVPLAYGLRYGLIRQAHDGMAVAIWLPPGRGITVSGMIRAGLATVPLRIGWRAFVRFGRANDVMGRIHKKCVPEPHWYLLIVGVDPEFQGRGLGSALVNEGLARADEARCPCYLETSDTRNLPWYERHGFKVVGTAILGTGGPQAWGMRREPPGVRPPAQTRTVPPG